MKGDEMQTPLEREVKNRRRRENNNKCKNRSNLDQQKMRWRAKYS